MIKLSRRKMPHEPRPHRHRASRGVLVLVVPVVLGCSVVGWRMWQAQRQREAHAIQWPTVNSVALPPDVEAGQTISLGGTANNLTRTKAGELYVGSCRIENRQWVVTLDWELHDADDERPTLHLGESAHLTGLGTITLLSVTLPSPAPSDDFRFPWAPQNNRRWLRLYHAQRHPRPRGRPVHSGRQPLQRVDPATYHNPHTLTQTGTY